MQHIQHCVVENIYIQHVTISHRVLISIFQRCHMFIKPYKNINTWREHYCCLCSVNKMTAGTKSTNFFTTFAIHNKSLYNIQQNKHEPQQDALKIICFISGVLCQKQVSRAGTSNYIIPYLWDVITCPCPWYLLLTQNSKYVVHPMICAHFSYLCFVVVKYWLILSISFRLTSLALGQSYDCPSVSEVTLKNMGKCIT